MRHIKYTRCHGEESFARRSNLPRSTVFSRKLLRQNTPCNDTFSRGVSLVELVISIVIISVALTGVLVVMNRTQSKSSDPMIMHQTVAVAEAYLEEIMLKNFTDPDVDVGETRPTFDDVDDYNALANNGCVNTTPACPVLGNCACDQNGNPISGLSGYSVTVAVDANAAETLNGIAAADVKRVDVTVNGPFSISITLSAYRTNY